MEKIRLTSLSENVSEERRPRRTPAQAAMAVNAAHAQLSVLVERQMGWKADGHARLSELMNDNVARMDAMSEGRQITHDIAAQQATLQEALPEAQPFYQEAGRIALGSTGIFVA